MSEGRFSADDRVRRQRDFERAYGRNVYAADATLVLTVCENDLNRPRLGLSVSRKVGNAVARNRWKRLIREAFRTQSRQLTPGVDYVVRPRKGATPNYEAIRKSLFHLARLRGDLNLKIREASAKKLGWMHRLVDDPGGPHVSGGVKSFVGWTLQVHAIL